MVDFGAYRPSDDIRPALRRSTSSDVTDDVTDDGALGTDAGSAGGGGGEGGRTVMTLTTAVRSALILSTCSSG